MSLDLFDSDSFLSAMLHLESTDMGQRPRTQRGYPGRQDLYETSSVGYQSLGTWMALNMGQGPKNAFQQRLCTRVHHYLILLFIVLNNHRQFGRRGVSYFSNIVFTKRASCGPNFCNSKRKGLKLWSEALHRQEGSNFNNMGPGPNVWDF